MRVAEVFEDALCVGQPLLFESTLPGDRETARELCARCPALEACRALLKEEYKLVSPSMRDTGGIFSGTWAGEFIGSDGFTSGACGTPRGYARHHSNSETPCRDCFAAHAQAAARNSAARKALRKKAS